MSSGSIRDFTTWMWMVSRISGDLDRLVDVLRA